MSAFDVEAFMSTAITEAFTKAPPIPEGIYLAIASVSDDPNKPCIRTTNTGKVILDIYWHIDDAQVKEVTKNDDPVARQSVFLDLDANGRLDSSRGANNQLRTVRIATGTNVPGAPFKFADLNGKIARVNIKHRLVNNEESGETDTYAEVKGVTKA